MSEQGAPPSPSLPASSRPAPALPATVDTALARLTLAVERLRATAEGRLRQARPGDASDAAELDHDAERALMADERARLAERLDAAMARVARLGEAHGAVLERLARAESAVGAVLRDFEDDEEDDEGEDAAAAGGVS